jgi:hypothetical protein
MLKFPNIDPDEERVLTFDFSKELLPGIVLQGGPTVSVVLTSGYDPNPSAMLLAIAAYDASGLMILQPVGNLQTLINNDYMFEARSATTEPNRIAVIRALLSVRVGGDSGGGQ